MPGATADGKESMPGIETQAQTEICSSGRYRAEERTDNADQKMLTSSRVGRIQP